MKKALLIAVRMYQVWLGPLVGGMCRFYPSCSHYAAEAIERHGAGRGTALAIRRVLRCHPFSAGGVDLVPENDAETAHSAQPHSAQPEVAVLPRTREEFGR
jgi:uncharacterized protein